MPADLAPADAPSILGADQRRHARAVAALRAGAILALAAEVLFQGFGVALTVPGLVLRCAAIVALAVALVLQRIGQEDRAAALTLGTVLMLPVSAFALDPSLRASPIYLAPLWSLSLMFLVAWHYSTWEAAGAAAVALAVLLMAPFVVQDLDLPAWGNTAVFFAAISALILYSYASRRRNLGLIESQARELADREARLRSILDTAFDGIAILYEGRVVEANQAFGRLLGLDAQAVCGPCARLVAPESCHLLGDEGCTAAGQSTEIDLLHADGSRIPVEIACRPYFRNGVRKSVLAVHDLRERRRVQTMRSELLVTASHELRTPLTAIHGSICTITDLMAEGVPPEVLKLMEAAKKSSSRLVRLVRDLLDAQRLESGEMSFHFGEVDLLDVAEDATEAVRLVAAESSVAIEIVDRSAGAQVRGDADRLIQVLVNLLANAIRYSPAGGTIRIDLGIENQCATVSVTDCGPGIPEPFQSRVFGRFARQPGPEEDPSAGTGLGLYVSHGIVTAHGGSIAFESSDGKGTSFRFTVPLWQPSH